MTTISRRVLVLAAVLLLGVACARVRPHVSLPDVELGDPSFYPTRQAYAGAPIVGGNAVTLLLNGEHFVLDDAMKNALLARIRLGVTVEVLVPGAIDHQVVRQASRAKWGDLLQAGVRIYEYKPALLHAKTIVIDSVWATVGSTNLDNRSFALNQELNVVTHDRGVAERLEAVFQEDLAHSGQVTYEQGQRRGLKSAPVRVGRGSPARSALVTPRVLRGEARRARGQRPIPRRKRTMSKVAGTPSSHNRIQQDVHHEMSSSSWGHVGWTMPTARCLYVTH